MAYNTKLNLKWDESEIDHLIVVTAKLTCQNDKTTLVHLIMWQCDYQILTTESKLLVYKAWRSSWYISI